MTVSFKVIDNRTSISGKIKDMERQLENYKVFFLQGMAEEIILASPVDTGTYITSHTISSSIPGGFTSSLGKPKNQDFSTYAQIGLNGLFSDIEAVRDLDLTAIRISNVSGHAHVVEYELGYAPYTMARDKASIISQTAAIKAKSI